MDIYNFLEEMWAKVTQSDGTYKNILHANCGDSDSKSNVLTFAICLFFIAQWAVRSWIIEEKYISIIFFEEI
jgi:hypothetical protein